MFVHYLLAPVSLLLGSEHFPRVARGTVCHCDGFLSGMGLVSVAITGQK